MLVHGPQRVAYRDDAPEPRLGQIKMLPSRPSGAAVEWPRSGSQPHPVVIGVRERIARKHSFAYRVSFPVWSSRSYYFAVFFGREQRGRARLGEERQTSAGARILAGAIALFAGSMIIFGTVCFGYLVKSALGLNLFSGPSPLHPLFALMFG